MNFNKEVAELQNALADTDFEAAISKARKLAEKEGVLFDLARFIGPVKVKMAGSKNHKRPHVLIDYDRKFHAATYAIDTGKRIVGNSKYDKEISEWIGKHQKSFSGLGSLCSQARTRRQLPLSCRKG